MRKLLGKQVWLSESTYEWYTYVLDEGSCWTCRDKTRLFQGYRNEITARNEELGVCYRCIKKNSGDWYSKDLVQFIAKQFDPIELLEME